MGKRKSSMSNKKYHYVRPKKKSDLTLVEHDHKYILTSSDCTFATDIDMDKNSFLYGVDRSDTEWCEVDIINNNCVSDQECYPYVSQSEVVEEHYQCHASEPEIVETSDSHTLAYQCLKQEIVKFLNQPYIMNNNADAIQIFELYPSSNQPSVKLSLTVDTDLIAKLCVHRIEITDEHDFWIGLSPICDSVGKIVAILDKLKSYSVCFGNPDENYQELVDIGCTIQEHSSGMLAYKEGNFCAVKGDTSYSSTIRSTKCKFLVQGARCQPCSNVRRSLRIRQVRLDEKRKNAENSPNYLDKKYRHCNMDRQALLSKLKQQQVKIRSLQEKVKSIRNEFHRDLSSKGVNLDLGQSLDFTDLMASCENEICKAYPDENSLQRLFWNEQRKCASVKSKSGMRWHPMIIRWCLHIRQKSASAYDALRDSGFITLPSSRTLFDYSHYIRSTLGFDKNVNKLLKDEAKKKGMFDEPWKSYVGILFDEIKVKADLVYDKHTGELIGYCELDKVGNQILELENSIKSNSPDIAKFMLVLMVRGITADLKFPFAAFATNGITSDLLYSVLWKAVAIMEINIQLKVLFFTCDGASPNRKFFQLHRINDNEIVYHTANPHCPDRNLYFVSDVPHLLKTTRNCFANSGSHKNTRKLWNNGKDISWLHILRLFEEHCELDMYNPCPKLSRAHIDLTSFSYMKVSLAAQVLSSSVSSALQHMYGDNVSETVNFIRNMDRFFDCLNVRSLYEGRNKRNHDLDPYTDSADERLVWLKQDFLKYFTDWRQCIERRPGNFTTSEKQSMMLSYQTLNGLKISVNSIVECVQFLLKEGASFVLTHVFNQDPLEQTFGHYRHRAGDNNNPTVYEVRSAMNSLRTVGAVALAPRNGNTRGNNENIIIDNTKLPKKR